MSIRDGNSVTTTELRRLLTSPQAGRLLSGADLFTLAVALSGYGPDYPLSVDDAIITLHAEGLPDDVPRASLARVIQRATAADPAFVAFNATSFLIDRRVGLPRRLAEMVHDPALQEIMGMTRAKAAAPAPSKPVARKPAPAASSKPVARKPAPAAPSKPVAPRPAPAAPSKPVAPALPPPLPLADAPVALLGIDAEDLARRLTSPSADLAAVSHTLRAYALAAAEQFEELLGLSSLEGVEPHRYQIETVRRVLRFYRGRALLADEVGLGKTIEALMILREYQLRGMARRALILVPPALLGQWVGELTEKAGITVRTTEDAARSADPEAFWREEGVVVASLALARSAKSAPLVHGVPWDLVIVDEAHHVKNRASASFKLINGLSSRFLLLLTATPIETDLEELYNLVTLLRPGQLTTPAAFRAQFVDAKDPLAPKNRERLRALLAEVMVRNTRADSGLALPPRFVSTVVVDPLPEERALYADVVAYLREHGGVEGGRMLASTLLLCAGSSPAALRGSLTRLGASDKRSPAERRALVELAKRAALVRVGRKGRALVDLARAHQEQILVFTRFRDTLADVEATLREAGLAPALFHGGLSAAEKRASLAAFKEGSARVLLATDVGGEGQNLHHCHVLVNFDLPYNPMLIEQRIGRLHRMGQREEVRVYNLCASGTAEERVLDLLDRRLHLFELVVGEMDMVLGNMTDERDLEERIVALYASSRSDDDLAAGFDSIAAELGAARGHYERVKQLDEKLFGKDYET
jgi:superfamily II DNA or RNA helicase